MGASKQMVKSMILDNFEHGDSERYTVSHNYVSTYDVSISNEQSVDGKCSLKLSYHLGGWKHGNGPMPIIFKDPLKTDKMPLKFSLWVYGDRKSPWLRAIFKDGNGERKTVNLTSGNVNWHGWKYIDVDIDPSWALPLILEQIYSVETNKDFQEDASFAGKLYFDQLRFVFIDDEDLTGPEFKHTFPEKDTVYQNTFTFQTTVIDKESGVDPKTVTMKIDGEEVGATFCEETNKLSYTLEHLEHGSYHIQVDAMDHAGNPSVPNIDRIINVDLTPDHEPPIITNITPTETAIEYTDTPRITFRLVDEKSGVDIEDIHITINGVAQKVIYDEETGWGYAVSKEKLKKGVHIFMIQAKDRSGNAITPIKREFTIKTLPKPTGDSFSVSIIPDTHRYEYGKLGIERALQQETDFIIQMGDLVDQATEEEYALVEKNLQLLIDKIMLTTPGNHEAFQGDIDHYMRIFGSPTFHFEYGNTLFIFLNTAYSESLYQSDATQMSYVENTLAESTCQNIILVTHVPTKDDFGTAHEMVPSEAKQLEELLGHYKKQRKEVNIAVLFGHLHVLREWEVEGVRYIITGNGAAKGYVAHEYGNIFGSGILHITPIDISYEFLPYAQEIFICKKDEPIEELTMRKGDKVNLQVYAHIQKLHVDYKIDLTNFMHIQREWVVTDQQIVHLNQNGVLKAIKKGEAKVSVHLGEQTASLNVRIVK